MIRGGFPSFPSGVAPWARKRPIAPRGSVSMYTKIQVTFDAAEPEELAEFWALALGYVVEPPPEGFASWEDFARSAGIGEQDRGEVASRVDPAGEGPRLYF